ncbi:hypothetical protein BGX29_011546 [Mortierella sp. GBA35]|nr:hypothetical protein BGX23_010850 [Mortierella sp. AD031]KAF9090316.1 hypothetical protein BGX29_011546 [Mortierella sp. GBA35]KAG0200028.1 hypothetical protein BGX33_011250 [Mortierella sp. NVP41]
MNLTSPSNPLLSHPTTRSSAIDTASQTTRAPSETTATSTSHDPVTSLPPSQPPGAATTGGALKADFSITLQSESTAKLNATFQRLMDTIHSITPGLSIRGPIRLPKDGKIHSRRVDIKAITERILRDIGAQSGILLSDDAGDERIQDNGVVVSFDIE